MIVAVFPFDVLPVTVVDRLYMVLFAFAVRAIVEFPDPEYLFAVSHVLSIAIIYI